MMSLRINPMSLRLLVMSQKLIGAYMVPNYTTHHVDTYEPSSEFLLIKKSQVRNHFTTDFGLNYSIINESIEPRDIPNMSIEEINNDIQIHMENNRVKEAIKVVQKCLDSKKVLNDTVIKDIFRHASYTGNVDNVVLLQNYCEKVIPVLYKRNGQFLHYLAKAQCMKGNSDKGLNILKIAYAKYDGLRGFYRKIFRELIHDTVQNRSEASMVTFKKYVLQFSEEWNDHYPLICFWHMCWSSEWYSDQTLSNDLMDSSMALKDIVRDKCLTFSINILRVYNEDAVVRMLQTLLKYNMMDEYVEVLQVLFSYKLKNRDLKGCTAIVQNCEALGVSLPSYQQGHYIRMIINTKPDKRDAPTAKSKKFKLQF